jgi:hypothetical protein
VTLGAQGEVVLSAEGTDVFVREPALRSDRLARMFFGSILGGEQTDFGWRCPLRNNTRASLIVRINTFLESKGWKVLRAGIVDETVQREIERRRSFQRAREGATAFRLAQGPIDILQVKSTLRHFGWDERNRELRPHQEMGLVHGLTAVNAANFSVPGAGKTAIAIGIAATHFANETIDIVVVIGPLACFGPWEREVKAAVPGRVATRRIRGTATRRASLYARVKRGELILLSFATAAADRLRLIELFQHYRVMLVVDESHRVKRFRGGLWAPALIELARHTRVRMILSGTPMPQHGRDLFSQLNILWPSGDLTGPRDSFAARIDKDFDAVLRDVQPFIARTPKEALGLKPYEVLRHEVPIVGTQAEIYELIESQFRKRIENAETWKEKIEALRRARPIRLLQAATNPDLLNRLDSYYRLPRVETASPTLMQRLALYRNTEVPAKSELALRLIADLVAKGEKAVCWSNFVPNLDHFADLVRNRIGVPCFQIDGRVATADEADDPEQPGSPPEIETRERIIEDFLDTASSAVLVTNPASCSESISLHRSCYNAIYLDRTYDCALFLQSIDRVHRLGLAEGVTVRIHILLATVEGRRSIDHLVDLALARKHDRMRQLLEGAELKPFNLSDDPLREAEGTDEDLRDLLRFLLGEEA